MSSEKGIPEFQYADFTSRPLLPNLLSVLSLLASDMIGKEFQIDSPGRLTAGG